MILVYKSMSLEGTEYKSEGGEVNAPDMLKSGTSFLSHDFKDTEPFAGSYAPIMKGVHQCGGKKKGKKGKKSKKKMSKKNKTQKKIKGTRKQKKGLKKRKAKGKKSRKNKRGGDSCNSHRV
tara:strand:- start:3138 stop:3500 length:363 start_codon:yes stop_codon:yes gene_type:complete